LQAAAAEIAKEQKIERRPSSGTGGLWRESLDTGGEGS
jgi:hypothetical protein